MGYRVLDHTADTGLELWADSREELFGEALRGFTDTITEVGRVGATERRTLEVRAGALDELLVEWLGELLFVYETEGLLFSRARVAIAAAGGGLELRAEARGEEHDPARHTLKTLVKAITYHRLEVAGGREGWRARVIFDI